MRSRWFKRSFLLRLMVFIWTTPALGASNCIVSESALHDLESSQVQMTKRAQELTQKELDLKAREQVLSEELKKLQALRDLVTNDQKQKEKNREEKVEKLMATLNSMNPKSASKILAQVDDDLATEMMFQMNTERLAKLMNVMEPQRASQLSERLAGLARAKDHLESSVSIDTAVAKELEWKGGEKNANDDKPTAKSGSKLEGSLAGGLGSKKP